MATINVGEEQIFVFAKKLASNNKTIRDRSVKKLRRWLELKSVNTNGFSGEDLMKIWKGIHFSFWMSDKPLIQEELASVLSKFIHSIQKDDVAFAFIDAFFATQAREWATIDSLRLDKFMMLIRCYLRESLVFLKNHNWEEQKVEKLLQGLSKTVMSCDPDSAPLGLKLHFIDIYLDELTKIGHEELSAEQVLSFLKPYCIQACQVENTSQLQRIRKRIFAEIIEQTENSVLEEQHDSDDTDDNEDETEKNPMLDFNLEQIADCLFEHGSSKGCLKRNRKKVYETVTKLRDAANGVFHHDDLNEVSDDEREFQQTVDKSSSQLLKAENQLQKEQAQRKRDRKKKRKLEQSSDEELEAETKRKGSVTPDKKGKNKYKKAKKQKKALDCNNDDSDLDVDMETEQIPDDILMSSANESQTTVSPQEKTKKKKHKKKKKKNLLNSDSSFQESDKEFEETPFEEAESEMVTPSKRNKQKAIKPDVLISDGEVDNMTTSRSPSVVEISSQSDVVSQNGSPVLLSPKMSKKKKRKVSESKTDSVTDVGKNVTESNLPQTSNSHGKSPTKKNKRRKSSISDDVISNNQSPALEEEVELWIPNKKYTGKYKDWFAQKTASSDEEGKENVKARRKSMAENSFATFEPVTTPPSAFLKKAVLKAKSKSEPKQASKTNKHKGVDKDTDIGRRVSFGLHKNSAQTTKEYAKQIKSTPEVPFHPEVKPDSGILKSTPVSSRKKVNVKRRSRAVDFF